MSAWDKVRDVVAKVAPGLATALGGPLAGVAVTAITQALGASSEDAAIAALSSSPDAILKLKQAELDFQKFLKEADIKIAEQDVADRKDARALAIAKGLFPQVSLSIVYTVGYFGMLFGLMSGWLVTPEGSAKLVDTLIAMLAAPQLQILNFWFGSSRGSQAKDERAAA